MSSKAITNLGLACQLLAASVGFCSAAPSPESRQAPADQQQASLSDRELMQKIRKAVVSDKSLSVAAHNIKIVSHEGLVTLKGTVKSQEERKAIEDAATGIAGQGRVTNDLLVAPGSSKQ